jgi:hypothetical protein
MSPPAVGWLESMLEQALSSANAVTTAVPRTVFFIYLPPELKNTTFCCRGIKPSCHVAES